MRTASPFLYGCLTGIICGVVISLFLVCAKIALSFSFKTYDSERTPLFVICIFMLVILSCLIMAVMQTLYPSSKGSGIPLAEGAARGMLSVKWLRSAAALIAGSLVSFLCGMPLGSEGPSIGVGGLIGEGLGKAAKKPVEFRRYLITGGASAGLAVAFNAPLTGVAFALEETHRRFSPGILLAAFSAVIPAVLVSQLMFWGFEQIQYLKALGVRAGEALLPFLSQTPYENAMDLLTVSGIAVLCGIGCALLGGLFNASIFGLGKLFGRIKSRTLRLLPAFILTAVCGLCVARSVGSGEATFKSVSTSTATWLLVTLFVLRFIMTTIASGSGATGGLFLPMIAIGGILGTLAAKAAVASGMDSAFAPNIIMLCISAFFAASARAPISAIAMAIELTASFSNLLPCAIAVAVATAIAGLMRSAPLYERMMEDLYESTQKPNVGVITISGVIPDGSYLCGRRIRDVLWPYNSLVTEIDRDGQIIVPDGETVLAENDRLTVRAENIKTEFFTEQLKDYIQHNLQ